MSDDEDDRDHDASWVPGRWDTLAAVLAVGLSVWVLAGADDGSGYRAAGPAGYALTALGSASLAWGRQRPLAALSVAVVTTTAVAILDHHVDVLPFVVSVLLFESASYLPRRRAAMALAMPIVALGFTAGLGARDLGRSALLQSLVIFVVVWVLGRLTRSRREALLALVEATEQRAALAQVEERLKIARELHDVLAHSIGVISVQATVGEHLSMSDPAAARASLHTIGELSRTSMREIRQMLALLRDTGSAHDTTSYAPAPGLGELDDLLATYRTAGLEVSMATTGEARPVSESAGLCGYRIVQEALTNTLRHSEATTAEVRLAYAAEEWEISVSDHGEAREQQVVGFGHGLVGMRERTALLGGRLEAGPVPSGGYLVRATIPYEADR